MIGLDMVEISRIERAAKREHFLKRVFTKREREYYFSCGRTESLAGMWCVKEAVGKALGTGVVFALTDVETVHDGSGKPQAVLHGKAAFLAAGRKVEVSITHTKEIAAAVAVIL